MEEKVYGVEMIYIHNVSGNNYAVECIGSHKNNVKLNYSNVESIELAPRVPTEIKHAYCQLAEGAPKVWNMKFSYAMDVRLIFRGKLVIEFE